VLGGCSLKLFSKNKHQKKQQRHARAEERIQIPNFVFHRKKKSIESEFWVNSKFAAFHRPFSKKVTKNCHLFSVFPATALVI